MIGLIAFVVLGIATFIGVGALVMALAEICAGAPKDQRQTEALRSWRNHTTRRPW